MTSANLHQVLDSALTICSKASQPELETVFGMKREVEMTENAQEIMQPKVDFNIEYHNNSNSIPRKGKWSVSYMPRSA